jgi:glucose-1-phosphatase
MKTHPFKNIIFDLGNVVIDINPQATYQAFSDLSNSKSSIEVEQLIKENNLWLGYEMGVFTEAEFRDNIRKYLDIEALDIEIDRAFNALLFDIDPARIDLIEQLSKKYRIFVLSNTSKIHMDEFQNILLKCTGRQTIWPLFEKPYFSFEMGKLKPNANIYEQVLQESNLIAEETLFIDDLKANIDAAKFLNINTIHLEKPFTIIDQLNAL